MAEIFHGNRGYNYTMGFAVNGTRIPDPSAFSGAVSALDLSAKRDSTGMMHRKYVTTKRPIKLEYKNIEWDMIKYILDLVVEERFTFTTPDPSTGELTEMECYTGDREWTANMCPENGMWIGDLKFSVIEY